MGLSSSLNASVMGLNANAQRLSGISDNIANSQTYGYKRAETDFTALVNHGNSRSDYNAGGVRATTVREVSTQGSLISTGNSTDISINGRGFIPVTTVGEREELSDTRPFLLTTTGSFTKDDDGFLRTNGGLQLLGWPTDESGDVGDVSQESASSLVPVNLSGFDFAPNATSSVEISVNLPSNETTTTPHTLTIEYFDEIGSRDTLNISYTLVDQAAGTWNMTVSDAALGTGAAAVVGEFLLDFATDSSTGGTPGSLEAVTPTTGTYDPATGEITIPAAAGDTSIDILIGTYGSIANTTLFSNELAPVNITKNGSTLGFLEKVELNDQGILEGIYDTGLRRSLFQIPIANVANPEGLTADDGQAFRLSGDSGPVYLWDANSGPVGSLNGYTLEESTTDITDELTQLIETQRAYSSNAKIVQTVDEMLQETTNLKR